MAENNAQTALKAAVEPETQSEPTRLQRFVNNHPRTAKVVAITGTISAVAGAVALTKKLRSNRNELESAADHANEALNDISSSVS